jgi:hypothetical protein
MLRFWRAAAHDARLAGQQHDQPHRLRGCRDNDARRRGRHADQGNKAGCRSSTGGCVAPDQDRKRSRVVRIAITAGDASLAMFTAFMGKLGMKLDDVQLISVATTTNLATALNTFAGQADQGNGV